MQHNLTLFKLILVSALSIGLTACASFSGAQLFSNYNQQLAVTLASVQQNQFNQALSSLPQYGSSNSSYVLNLLERARLSQLNDDAANSINTFETAINLIDQQNFSADIQIGKALETTTSFITNDNVRSYFVPSYEQTMVHTLQTFNYLKQKNSEAALVEVRRANLVQEQALQQNFSELEKAANDQRIRLSDLYASYPSMDSIIGDVKNGFQNAFTFYLSAFLYEATGEYDSAYIDYKRAIEIFPDNRYLQHDVLRLAKQLGFANEYQRFKKQFTPAKETAIDTHRPVLIVLEQGLIPAKTESRIDLPIYTSGNDLRFYSVAVPSYQSVATYNTPLNITANDTQLLSEPIVNLSSLAAKDLKDRMPGIVARQITRVVAKEELRQSAARNGGDVGNIIAAIYNMASERADTRSWLTLANNYQIAKTYLPVGESELQLQLNGVIYPITVNIKHNESTLVKVVNIGAMLNTSVFSI